MLIGYARVLEDDDQNLDDLQRDALRAAGCQKNLRGSNERGAKAARPGLAQAMEVARANDVVAVCGGLIASAGHYTILSSWPARSMTRESG